MDAEALRRLPVLRIPPLDFPSPAFRWTARPSAHRLLRAFLDLMHGAPMIGHAIMLQLKPFNVATTTIHHRSRVRPVKPRSKDALEMVDFQSQQGTRMFNAGFEFADDVHDGPHPRT